MPTRKKASKGKTVAKRPAAVKKLPVLPPFFRTIGITSPYTLYSLQLKGQLDGYAQRAGLKPAATKRLMTQIVAAMPAEVKKALKDEAARPVVTGHIDWTDLQQKQYYEAHGIKEPKPLSPEAFAKVPLRPLLAYLVPHGPVKAVDLRPFLGDPRDQQGRGTCGVFAGTAVAEAFEYFRDRRAGPVDLSEEFVWWYRGAGQRYGAGGYSGDAALDDIRDVGVCEESVLPYNGTQINDNHNQVPIRDVAMDRAQFYCTGGAVALPWGDVDAVKRVIDSGRCVCYASNLDGWNTGTGEIAMPPAGTSLGGSHCTTIVGYIDRDDLPADYGGGYFIIRNSWDGTGSPANVLGPEYGGHLLMPYSWYRLYAGWPNTVIDKDDGAFRSQWLVEYYDNPELRGAPIESRSVRVPVFPIGDINITVPMPSEVTDVDFDWGGGSPVRFVLPLPPGGTVDALPTDNFSVRFSKVTRFRAGWYRFHLRADDGVRLYVDDRLVVNEWKDQPDTGFTAEHYLTGGDHILRIEYYEAQGNADVHFAVEPISWHYELFSNPAFAGTPSAAFDDTLTQLEWRHVPPITAGPLLHNGQFGLRGSATLTFKGGDYRFHNFSTGPLRMYLDGTLIADLTHDGDFTPVTVAAGAHQVRIEFVNASTVPTAGSHTYYKALCHFAWSEATWNAKFYKNDRCAYYGDHGSELNANPDHDYLFFRTLGLAGHIQYQHEYPEAGIMDNQLRFNSWDDPNNQPNFKTGVTDWPASFALHYWGVWINRKIAVAHDGLYNLTLDANEGFRLVVDGKAIVQSEVGISNSPYNADVFLERGVHDVSIEYDPTIWGGNLIFAIQPAEWHVDYYANTTLQGEALGSQSMPIAEVVNRAAAVVGRTTNYSARISRALFLPLGKYAVTLKVDDGVRLTVNHHRLIDAWYVQAPTGYTATFEHQGGEATIEIEYYQAEGGALLEFSLSPTEFYAEYYGTSTLNQMPAGVERPRVTPLTYRYDEDIRFDWGLGSQWPRVGATNFSVRWRGKVHLPVGRWRIEAAADDGIRVYIGGRLLIDQWHPQALTTYTRMIDLVGRDHDVMVEYFQQAGTGACRVKYVRVI